MVFGEEKKPKFEVEPAQHSTKRLGTLELEGPDPVYVHTIDGLK
jgi:hypothetical protein